MSAIRLDAIEVDVTHSDCIPDNQFGNSQNYTKTYFVSSDRDFEPFRPFFGNVKYKVRRDKVAAYKRLMHELYEDRFEQYQGKGIAFDTSCDFLINQTVDPVVEISIREKNPGDDRNFMKFNNGREPNAKAFKAMLYEGISHIVITRDGNEFGVYPVVLSGGQALPVSSNEIPSCVLNSCVRGSLQRITYGAPGTGKSYTIDKCTNESNSIRVTFHPDTDYSAFVGAYKPTMDEQERYALDATGQTHKIEAKEKTIAYTFVPQAFMKAYVEAWRRYTDAGLQGDAKTYYLVIEEINRGNCAQIFGDLFQLLDRADNGFSAYAITPDDDIQKFLEKDKDYKLVDIPLSEDIKKLTESGEKVIATAADIKTGKKLVLPPNLCIWATMNTSDQSLFPIDSAFKRRWDWKYVPIKNANLGWVIKFGDCEIDWWKFLLKINKVVKSVTNSADKQLGYFFVKLNEGETEINAEMFVNKVAFYLWNDVFKDCELDGDAFKITREDGDGVLAFEDFFKEDGSINEDVLKNFLETLVPAEAPVQE